MKSRAPRNPHAKKLPAPGDIYWMFGLHSVRAALENPDRALRRLVVTKNAADQLADAIAAAGIEPEMADARRFPAPLDPNSVHQGAALETEALDWGEIDAVCQPEPGQIAIFLDRLTDPHNVGAILRSAEVFGAAAVVAPLRHSAPESGALAKAASGALERQPYLRVRNLSDAMQALQKTGYVFIALDGTAELELDTALSVAAGNPIGLVLGAEGPGLRQRTRETADALAKITPAQDFASLNVSNAAAVALYAASQHLRRKP